MNFNASIAHAKLGKITQQQTTHSGTIDFVYDFTL